MAGRRRAARAGTPPPEVPEAPAPKRPRVSQEQRAAILEAYQTDEPMAALCARLLVSKSTVARLVKDAGLPLRQAGRRPKR